jgi:energy-converting hydrogenase Eha subunit A
VEEKMLVRASSKPRSVLWTAALVYFTPLMAIGVLALFAFGLGTLAVFVELLAELMKLAGI